ncbi:FAD/NAD(P)-binding protein [Yinghuangia seranimata]|uniref:FAD/NAD(P)-binding protein n=1 Tax=Yinghuangia seranimata TaxID=408067 RepID=UPI00248D140A|nr:FAD/NAD(P)-binding protein [Yinghuangia seranimata]MDI2130506.1 FAD/NAD(P)-binding protein [Yinghuangia seranimata]
MSHTPAAVRHALTSAPPADAVPEQAADHPPAVYRVQYRNIENDDTVTLALDPDGSPLPPFAPGQFAMLYAFGVGEVPISVSGIPYGAGPLRHTIRAVGPVSSALHRLRPGDRLGVRGPFGTGWDLDGAAGGDVLVVAGGIGLAPLRPLVHAAFAAPRRFRRLSVLVGARSPADLLYRHELDRWRERAHVAVTVDRPDDGWTGNVGVVTALLNPVVTDPSHTTAFVCGPEAMIRHTARDLLARGLPSRRIRVSLERNMRCGTATCGHCQLGPLLLCREGPVVGYDRAADLMNVRGL